MLQFDGFFKYQRRFHRDQRARSGAPRQLLQAQAFLSETFAERNFRQCGQGVQIADAPAVEGFEQTVGGFFLISVLRSFSVFPVRQTKLPLASDPNRSASLPTGITVTPENPRAASTAASGLEATATLASSPSVAARWWMAREISGNDPKRDSMPARSSRAVSQAASSTQGENDWAQSSKAACAADSCSGERGRKTSPGTVRLGPWSCPARCPCGRLFH